MFSKKPVGAALVIAACAILVAAFLWSRRTQNPAPQTAISPAADRTTVKPTGEQFEEMSAFVAVTPYGYDRDDMNVGEWQIAADVKDAVEGKEGCRALDGRRQDTYIPVAFGDGARCEIVKKDGVTIVYGVGYANPYEHAGILGAAVYVFHTDGFVIQRPSDLPELHTYTPEQEAALSAFEKTHYARYAEPDWPAYEELNHSYLRKELEAPSPRVAEAMEALRAHVESLKL